MFSFLVAVVTIFLLWWYFRRSASMPPGPYGLPLVGYLFSLTTNMNLTLQELGKKYGEIFTLPMGLKIVVVLNGWKEIKEAFITQGDLTIKRTDTPLVMNIHADAQTECSSIKIRRRFTMTHMRSLGFGKKSMEDVIMDEMDGVIVAMHAACHQKVHIKDFIKAPILNILWKIVGDLKFSSDDKHFIEFSSTLQEALKNLCGDMHFHIYPWLRFFSGNNSANNFHKKNKTLLTFMQKIVNEHITNFDKHNIRDFIDIYLNEIYTDQGMANHKGVFHVNHLIYEISTFFLGGTESVLAIVLIALTFTAAWPMIQEKIHEEIDSVLGRDRRPSYFDRTALPYTEAVILESYRHASDVLLPRRTNRNSEIGGFKLPNNSLVLANIPNVHQDPHLWGDPEIFRPERFINSEGYTVKPEYLLTFSLGARSCIGEPLAKMEVFLILTSIWQQFSLRFPTGEISPPPIHEELMKRPEDYLFVFQQRGGKNGPI